MVLIARRSLVIGGAAVLLALAAIGIVRATTAAQPSPAAPATLAVAPAVVPAVAPMADPGTTAADDSLGADLDAILTADQASPSTAPRAAALRGPLRRLAALNRLVHATVVVDLKNGGLTTIELDHGTISAVGASSITVAETGGTSVTVSLGADTRVRRSGAKATAADLKAGDEVYVMSRVEAGGTTAYLVVVPKR